VHSGQNGGVLRRLFPITAALLLALGSLAGCGGDDGDSDSDDPAPSASGGTDETEGPYLPVPKGVELTEPGSDLDVGEPAVIAWQPRQNLVGVLDIEISRLEKTSFAASFEGWDVRAEQEKNVTPYFVHATVSNRGATNLSERLVPLYAIDSGDTLVEPTKFTEAFEPCPGGTLPTGFFIDDTADVCLVYLIGEGLELSGVTFRPTEDFDAITWSGEIHNIEKKQTPDEPEQTEKDKKKGNRGNNRE